MLPLRPDWVLLRPIAPVNQHSNHGRFYGFYIMRIEITGDGVFSTVFDRGDMGAEHERLVDRGGAQITDIEAGGGKAIMRLRAERPVFIVHGGGHGGGPAMAVD